MNDCTFQPRLSAYYDGELSDADRAALKRHLSQCPPCAAELAAYGKLSLALSQERSAAIPSEAMNRLRMRVRKSAQQRWWREASVQFDRTVRRVTAAAAVVLVGASAALMWLPGKPETSQATEVLVESLTSSTDAISQTISSPGGEERQLARWIVADLSQRDADRANNRP